ncbi:MAG TPA: prolyl-tRNA synthetase associated domain-containing protein [Beijerinckiaceae bacterium]|nr:prolyl-tRNA synthetase associated domain-containing protein [Beijerinckiaceae bacterium]
MNDHETTDISAPLLAFLDRLGIETRTMDHAPVFTVAESQALRGAIAGAHSKNLFVKDKKGRLFLVTALEDASLDLKRLHEAIGAQGRVSFASADQLREHLGIEPGSVTPFAVMNDRAGAVTMVLQEALMRHDVQNFHPLTNRRTTTIRRADLVRFLEAANHPPRIVALPEAAK